jgi:putative NIF3 family GTP cyclohydrolase 1 type 2
MAQLADITGYLDGFLEVHRFGDDQGGVWRPSDRPVRRLGLALEPWPGLGEWTERARLDALFLHRPWRLAEDLGDVGVLAYHLAFDEALTTGYNPRLAAALGMGRLETLGPREGRPLGMLGETEERAFDSLLRVTEEAFGGVDGFRRPATDDASRVAVVGAMTDGLVREAGRRGVGVYVTGQWRRPAERAVEETGLGVIAVGHRRSEEWGLRALAGALRERWAGLECIVRAGEGP